MEDFVGCIYRGSPNSRKKGHITEKKTLQKPNRKILNLLSTDVF